MDIGGIAQMSIDMHMAETQEAVGVALMKKAMDTQEVQAAGLLEMMQPTSFGRMLDTYI